MSGALSARQRAALLAGLVGILLIRCLTLGAYPLIDTSEARYGEIARTMLELDDWVTPWFDHGVPFWGKPPLAFWLSAASAKVLGVSEFALRLPSFLLGLATLALTAGLASSSRSPDHARVAALALASSALFFIASGAVFTDTALAFCVTLALAGFWRGVAEPGRHAAAWRCALFAALGLGLLAKGPVALVLAGAPILVWALLTRRLWRSIRALPWLGGVALMLMLALPWYLLAEQRTPGFLEYFLVGENFKRFTDPGWTGDLYGGVRTRPWGYIWLLWLGAALPWSPFLIAAARPAFFRASPWRLYLLCFALAPGVFFTFAGSVLPPYVLPGLPALALLLAEWWFAGKRAVQPQQLTLFAAAMPLLFALALPVLNARFAADRSQRELLARLPPRVGVVYYPERPFSGQFYSQGRARQARDEESLLWQLTADPGSYIVTLASTPLPSEVAARYRKVADAGRRNKSVLWAPSEPGRASAHGAVQP